jgi:hypothetical protein
VNLIAAAAQVPRDFATGATTGGPIWGGETDLLMGGATVKTERVAAMPQGDVRRTDDLESGTGAFPGRRAPSTNQGALPGGIRPYNVEYELNSFGQRVPVGDDVAFSREKLD